MRDIRTDLLIAGTALAHEAGWPAGIIRDKAAARAGCSSGMVTWCFGDLQRFKEAVMSRAVEQRDLVLVAQGLAQGSPAAREAPETLRHEALRSVA